MTALVQRPDLSLRKALSKSQLTTFDLCQQKAFYAMHDYRPVTPNERMTFGSAVDAAVEQILVSARAGVPIEMGRVLAAATEVILRDDVPVSLDEVEHAAERFGIEVLNDHDWSYCTLQGHYSPEIEGLGASDGHPDIVLSTNDVRDVKTSQRAKDDEPTLELGFYALLVEAETGKPVPTVGYFTWVRLKRPYWQKVAFPVTDELRRWAYERAAAFVRARKADEVLNAKAPVAGNYSFPGGPKFKGLCSDCEYNPANGGPCLLAFREPTSEEEVA